MEAQRIVEALERMIALGEEMLTSFDVEALLIRAVRHAQDLLHAEGATLFLIDPLERLLISHVILSDRVEEIVLPIDETSVAGFTALFKRALNIPDAYGDLSSLHPRLTFNRAIDESHGQRTRTILSMPVTNKGDVIGVFQVVNKKGGPFSPEDERLLRSFAVMVGIAVRNVRLIEQVTDEREKNRDIIENISDRVVVLDRECRVVDFNRQAREVLTTGLDAKMARGQPLATAFAPLANLEREVRNIIDQSLDKQVVAGKTPYLLLASKNARNQVERVFLIMQQHQVVGGPEGTITDN